ncbi:MAG: bile acid:sodium symporter family protein [Bacillota bacterium]|jgi:BASS family bile acid:Na+ symporter|uniref:bile acid:sodium symporter family protein n=1 Tax=Bacillaceae TaxID=186817 RepID=UPI0013D7BF50|nr:MULTISPECIES: bile acid:sodium symporter family protein [Bacillaceae]MCC3645850.1 bile acid:sodium symporter family protein [Cytobacillus oceanisediminis]MCS0652449.1 bile acid:sodium symporter family protein [Cytobacillus firmus]MCU1804351.1 bile acid:sodium symporter family protein [Cytobacillus firmus]URT72738.1 bile acid:sodium symporter family protein [Cytobacillus firmus]WHY36042.1 bile acid:sodium symporter family protein [Cytobacillus firmus]
MKVLEAVSTIAGKYFAVWVILTSVIAFMFPDPFLGLGGYITILLGVVMFGMGLTLKAVDFKIIFTKPLPVLIGVCAQFIIMPLVAFVIAKLLNLPAELAAGLVLLGCVPGGTASNVMVYLAKGNVPLSIAMTSVSTLLAPIMTPLILLLLAGQWMPVDAVAMFMSIVQVIIVPIVLGLAIKKFFPAAVEKSLTVLPLISVAAIITIVAAVVSGNSATIAASGLLIFTAVMLHNGFGLLLGYFAGKVLGQDEVNRRAIAIEVGMQNSGLGVALATAHFGPLAALPSVLAAAWHNISGPILATYWSKKPAVLREEDKSVRPVEVKL